MRVPKRPGQRLGGFMLKDEAGAEAGLWKSLAMHIASGAQMGLTIGPVLAVAQMPLSAVTKKY